MSNPFDNVMKQVQNAQANLSQIQDVLAKEKLIAESGAGMVKITCNGLGETLSVEIDESVYKEDKSVLQDLLKAAMNDVQNKQKRLKDEKMKELMSGLGLPSNLDLPFMN